MPEAYGVFSELNNEAKDVFKFSRGGNFGDHAIAVGAAALVIEKCLER